MRPNPHLTRTITSLRMVGLLAFLALGACSKGGDAGTSTAVAAVIGAETAVAKDGPFTETVGAIGTVEPRAGHVAVLSAPVATRVAAVLVSAGQHVTKGEVLLEFEKAAIAAEAQSAEASLVTVQQAYDRAQRMVNEGIAARRELEAASAELSKAKATVAAARRTAELATVRAPLTGVVTRMSATLGASVDPSQPLVEVADLTELDIVLSLPPADAARVRQGAKVLLHTGAGPNGEALGEGSVVDVSGIVDSATHSVAVRARSGKLVRALRIGETLFGEVVLATRPHAITIPTEALVPEGDGYKVFVVDSSGIAHARQITAGGRTSGSAEITKGLAAGERVVTYGAYGVTDSAKIVRPGEKPKATDSAVGGA
jgi:membrane fusion protein (multidrug efflux system)